MYKKIKFYNVNFSKLMRLTKKREVSYLPEPS